jgi:glycosyltransferase involved in cell wall biosynthesis
MKNGQDRQDAVKMSVVMLTYNHGPYIAEAIEGVLMQETNFSYELVIAEDCSTDDTRTVIRKYWEQYPDRIRVLLNRHNIGGRRTHRRGYQMCRGQYVASLDADDYWVSPHKLQRQADLLDAHPEYAMCFHAIKMVWEDDCREPTVFRPRFLKDSYTLEDLLEYNFIGACSPVYRKRDFGPYPSWFFVMPVGDWATHVLHALHGKIGYIDEPMGVYRQHGRGIYSVTGAMSRLRLAVEMLRRFRCGLGHEHRRIVSRSLCRQYDKLVRQCYDDGDVSQARHCAWEGLRDVGIGPHAPVLDLLKISFRMLAPGVRRRPLPAVAGLKS